MSPARATAQEALRDLLRTREDAREDLLRRRHRLSKFLLRLGRRYTEGERWTTRHWDWIRAQTFTERNAETVFRVYIVAMNSRAKNEAAPDGSLSCGENHNPRISA
jgi:hypothetical protein